MNKTGSPLKQAATDPGKQPLRSFGRTGGRPLSPRRAELVERLLPDLAITVTEPINLTRVFGYKPSQVWLEIGFGGGEHLAQQAASNRDAAFLAAEPFVEGVAKLLSQIEEQHLKNVRIHQGDAREVLERLPPRSLDRVFILFPDPWPKRRHQKRRLVQPEFLDLLARVLSRGASVRFATDVAGYANEALLNILRDGRFSWVAESVSDWRTPPTDHFTTRYESKRLGDCPPVFFDFEFLPPEC